ncbi:ATP-dependent (S)-NAD(P)H-hydrate dehydratase-like isoform X2 [Zophobas morio]|uniref:ATP-dependent (S)-NAD(P)H-hydrate dehydratase-like isoform X2 n=1 Tax=Zophobas morio TaxID=2755281 RepID=UPI0030838286
MPFEGNAIQLAKEVIPKLSQKLHKGQAGRIGVVGGSFLYSGAPYFCATSSLLMGADLCFVFCTKGASVPLKSYGADLIIAPLLKESKDFDYELDKNKLESVIQSDVSEISQMLSKIHAIIVGPGLGRDPIILDYACRICKIARQNDVSIVVDADGCHLVTQNRLCKAILSEDALDIGNLEGLKEQMLRLSKKLGHVNIVRKDRLDIITDGRSVLTCDEEGSLRRCGGQGDILSGITATLFNWSVHASSTKKDGVKISTLYSACVLTRLTGRLAFEKYKRTMRAGNYFEYINDAFTRLFEMD